VRFTVNTKEFINGLELSALKGKYFSSTGLKSDSLSDNAFLVFEENQLMIFNGNDATALCVELQTEEEQDTRSGNAVIPIKKTVDYLKKMGEISEIAVGDFVVIFSGEKRVQVPSIAEHEAGGFISLFRNNYMEYNLESEEITYGRDSKEYQTILTVSGEVFSNAIQLCEITNSGIYKLDVNEEAFTISSENGIEKFETRPAAVFQKSEEATVEFTAPLHRLFPKDETIKICFNDNTPIFIIGENAKVLRAPYVQP